MSVEVDSGDVIKVILQYLVENGLLASAACLSKESQVGLNVVPSVKDLHSHVVNGRWEFIIKAMKHLMLPTDVLQELYEQLVLEMAELGETDTGLLLLSDVDAMQRMRKEQPSRYSRLAHLVRTYSSELAYPDGSDKASRRKAVADRLSSFVREVPSSRLLALISQALKWQQHQGLLRDLSHLDLLAGISSRRQETAVREQWPTRNDRLVKFGSGDRVHGECVGFSPDGTFLVTGNTDGFLEVWDFDTGKLRRDLQYQADEHLMMHADIVLCLAFSRDSELLVSGSRDGQVKVWRIRTGACVRRLPSAHSAAVSTVCFAADSTQVLTGALDGSCRVHGLRSGRALRDLRGHQGPITSAVYSHDGSKAFTGCKDGHVRVWVGSDCVASWKPHLDVVTDVPVLQLLLMPNTRDQLLVVTRSNAVRLCNADTGEVLRQFQHPPTKKEEEQDMRVCCVSGKGGFVFAVGSDTAMYCYDAETAELKHMFKCHLTDVVALAHHPHLNLLASLSLDSTMKLWRP